MDTDIRLEQIINALRQLVAAYALLEERNVVITDNIISIQTNFTKMIAWMTTLEGNVKRTAEWQNEHSEKQMGFHKWQTEFLHKAITDNANLQMVATNSLSALIIDLDKLNN